MDTLSQLRQIESKNIQGNNDFPFMLAYDDVLLVPKRSRIESRRLVNTETNLTKNIKLSVPIIGANMDTVCESEMAIALARVGGIGIIHRFLTIDEQVLEVKKVKEARHWRPKEIYTIEENQTLGYAWQLMERHKVSSLIVVSPNQKKQKPVGILTTRDIIFEDNPSKCVGALMTKAKDLITASPEVPLEKMRELLAQNKIEKLPLVNSKGELVGLATAQDLVREKEFNDAVRDASGALRVGGAIGVRGDYLERAIELKKAGADVLVLDIAHGHSDRAIAVTAEIKNKLGIDLIAGNVATSEGVCDLASAGADAVKVGVGPGSACTTRIVAGVGVPQFSAVLNCALAGKSYNIPIIADGGIRSSGDIAKAIGAGASSVMIGNLLAGCKECPGRIVERDGKLFKVYRGMASQGAAEHRSQIEKQGIVNDWAGTHASAEGVEAVVPYKGSVINLLRNLVGGLKSGMSYINAQNISVFQENASFVRITSAGLVESKPHDLVL